MRNITLTFEDGTTHQYNNVPDDVTPKQINDRASQEFKGARVSNIDGGKQGNPATQPQESTNGQSLGRKVTSGIASKVKDAANLGAGLLRGAGSIGSTILLPADMINQKLRGEDFFSMKDNRERRKSIDAGLEAMGADTDSGSYSAGKLVGEIAGTAGAGGIIGNTVGRVAPALGKAIASAGFNLGRAPAVTIGGKSINAATRVGGGAVSGAGTVSMVNPDDALMGAGVGAAFPVAGKIAGYTGGAINSAVRPFYEKGRDKILGARLVEQAGAHPIQVINNLKNAQGNTAGFNPTVGQAAGSDELATMERVLRGGNPGAFQDTMEGQTKALANTIRSHGGDDIQRQALVDARTNASEPFFNAASNQPVQLTPEMAALMQRPSMQQATGRAGSIALEKGVPFNVSAMTGADAQRIKMGLDDLINTGHQGGIGANELSAIRDTKGSYLSELEKQIPDYIDANKAYKSGSEPINQMDLGNAITDKLIPATQREMDVPVSLNYEQFARSIRDSGDGIAKKVTGFKGSTLENTASPKQLQDYENALKDIEYIKNGMRGKMGGSDTFQNLLFDAKTKDGILAQLPFFKGVNAASLLRLRDFIYKQPNEALQQKLLTILQDPKGAAVLMESSQNGSATSGLVRMLKNPALASATEVTLAQ